MMPHYHQSECGMQAHNKHSFHFPINQPFEPTHESDCKTSLREPSTGTTQPPTTNVISLAVYREISAIKSTGNKLINSRNHLTFLKEEDSQLEL